MKIYALLFSLLIAFSVYPAEGYYKDLFMDGGVALTPRTTLPAADSLKLSWEQVSTSSRLITLSVIQGDSVDSNGVLLYPDGQPRFHMIYVNGGQSRDEGDSLGPDGRQRLIDFYNNGGSYSGSCAGAIMTSINATTSSSTGPEPRYLHIYPALTHYTQLNEVNKVMNMTGMLIPPTSPVLKYYSFEGNRLDSVRHNGGVYLIQGDSHFWAPGTEVLATFTTPVIGPDTLYQKFINNVSTWAYKTSPTTGRLVLTGSHPEGALSGSRMHFFAGMLLYAMEGSGTPQVKAVLDDRIRIMNDNSKKGYEKIGDKQYHHYKINLSIPTNLTVRIDAPSGYNFHLFINRGDFAFAHKSSVFDTSSGSSKSLTINNAAPGTWYVGVKLASTVTAKKQSWGYEYSGKTEVLNGISYTIEALMGSLAVNSGNLKENKAFKINVSSSNVDCYMPFKGNMKIFDLSGRMISSKDLEQGNQILKLNIPSGFYIIKIKSGSSFYQKIFKLFS